MAKLSIHAGSTSVTLNVFIQDSSSTVGAGLNGLTNATANMKAYYARQRGNATSIGFASLGSATAGWTSGGFVGIDTVNMVGWYRFDVPDAAFASGSPFVSLEIYGATNMAPAPLEVEITAVDNQDSIRFGLTALPNAVAGATNGLVINGANTGAITLGNITTGTVSTGNVTVGGTLTVTGATSFGSTFAIAGTTTLAAINTGAVSTGNVTVGGTMTVTGATSFGSTFAIAGTTTLAAVNTGAITTGTVSTGNVTVGGTLTTTGTATLNALTVTNAFTTGNVTHGTVSTGNVTIGGTMTVTGATSFGSTFAVAGTTTLAAVNTGAISTGNVTIGGTATVTGAVALQSTLVVTGTTTFTGPVLATNASNDIRGVSLTVTPPTTTQIAAAVWQDAVAGDFTITSSIGKSLYTSGNAPGAASGLALVGSNMGTVTGVTGLTPATIATAVWQDTTAGDFTVSTSPGQTIFTSLRGAFGAAGSSTYTVAALQNAPTGGSAPTAAAIATAVWQDTTTGDFTVSTSPGKIVFTQLGGAFTTTSSSVYTVAALANAPTGGSAPTTAQIATAVWQDLMSSGDFTVSGSVGKLINDDINATISSRLASASYTTPPTTAQVATAVWQDLTSSGDMTISGSIGKLLVTDIDATISSRSTYAGGSVTLGTAGLDSVVVETGVNARQALVICAAASAGVLAGAGTSTITIKGANVATTRITATGDDSLGNRPAITLNLP